MTSRLIIKGLPSDCTEKMLRKAFKEYGDLTDCTLKYTKEGKFRKFAFIGFQTDGEGENALNNMNHTFIGTAKIQVEKCESFANKPKPQSKYSQNNKPDKRKLEDLSGEEAKRKKLDPQFEEFLETRGQKAKKEVQLAPTSSSSSDDLQNELLDGISGDTRLSLIFLGLPTSIKPNSIKEWLSPVRVKGMKIVRNDKEAAAFVTFNRPPDVRRALGRDKEFLGGYKITVKKIEEKHTEKDEKSDDEPAEYDHSTEEAKVREQILESGRLFLRNLPFKTKEADLQAVFKRYGEIAEIQVILDKKTGDCKGYAIVEFVFPETAVAAYAEEDGKVFKGRMMHILPGSEKKKAEEKHEDTNETEGQISFKKEKAAKLKASAVKTHSWNTLFMGANAVAETLADKLGVEKSDILLGEKGESAAVRLALAETRLVREVREFLVSNGVKLDSFSRPASKRSDTVMIIKNLPAGVKDEELQRMFERHGTVEKILMPPEAAVSALVVMNNSVEAKKAFSALAYSRFRTQPLYLEWAPGDVFEKPKPEEESKKKNETVISKIVEETPKKMKKEMSYQERKALKLAQKEKIKESVVEPENSEDVLNLDQVKPKEEPIIESDSTVFVKNLSFETTDDGLEKLFSQRYHIKSAQVSKKLNPADPSKSLSMGFGFVQFYTNAEAKKAIKELQGEMLEGHCLELKLSNRTATIVDSIKRKDVSHKKQGNLTKIIVRNIPFQAKIDEVENLFSTFGEIRNIRIPKKLGAREEHRGFGFIDFMSVGEAKRAFEALSQSTHLYGRRLVLEWAREEETVVEMREKTADKFSGESRQIKKQRERIRKIEDDLTKLDADDSMDTAE